MGCPFAFGQGFPLPGERATEAALRQLLAAKDTARKIGMGFVHPFRHIADKLSSATFIPPFEPFRLFNYAAFALNLRIEKGG
jgi:hypothetical protein